MSPPGLVHARMRWWHVAAVAALERRVFGPSAWSEETFWSELAAPGRWYRVLLEPGAPDEPLGYAGLARTGADADVQTLAVAPRLRGHGAGALLLDALVDRAARAGATALLLEVRADSEAATGLYRSRGFERIAVRRRYYQPGDVDAHVMRLRPLPAAAARPDPRVEP